MELFVVAILVSLIFGSFSYMLLQHADSVLKVSSFSKERLENPFIKRLIKFMGWWFLFLVAAVWILAIVSLFD
ncbi:hypothetical protein [Bacillus badius]|uniref:Uncharacterized protein n=1 Tax=Bacillus badius TaxID=1455 RepID=A0ABR5AZ92_BACBA|nr:hypothetical protein [Bacillus badius]KIL74965.1 hypothetical protein SD78_2034 [Bacillus badius]KIL80053.1 hypothetical protein SD77_2507 [Bacillus badius]MED4717916.1 hypothetical protein [Bacillus badius]